MHIFKWCRAHWLSRVKRSEALGNTWVQLRHRFAPLHVTFFWPLITFRYRLIFAELEPLNLRDLLCRVRTCFCTWWEAMSGHRHVTMVPRLRPWLLASSSPIVGRVSPKEVRDPCFRHETYLSHSCLCYP